MDLSKSLQTLEEGETDSQVCKSTVLCGETKLTLWKYAIPGLKRRAKTNLLTEMRKITDFSNGHIARVYAVWGDKDQVMVLQERVSGESLGEVIARQERKKLHFSEPYVWRLAYELCIGLLYLQTQGLPYIPLASESVKTSGNDRWQLVAWHEVFLRTKLPPEDERWQSPEEVYSNKRDQRSDVWTLGCILYHVLSYQYPFGTVHWPPATELNSLQVAPLPPCYSDKITHFVLKMLYKRPENRPSLSQIISEIPIPIRLRYISPEPTKDLNQIRPKEDQSLTKISAVLMNQSTVDFAPKAPFRFCEVTLRSVFKNNVKNDKDKARERAYYTRRTNLRPNSSSPMKRKSTAPAVQQNQTIDNILTPEPAFFSKPRSRVSSRLSSRDSLNLSYDREQKRPPGSRPTIGNL